MNDLDRKLIEAFPGKVVRKDLTAIMKRGANVPTYVLEYLLGMYCSSDDEDVINAGIEKIKNILSQNYVRPDQREYIKSKIRENGEYTIIDRISVTLNTDTDEYIAHLSCLAISFEISSDVVTHNEKLLLGGIWCIVRVAYNSLRHVDDFFDESDDGEFFGNRKAKRKKGKKTKDDSPFSILTLKPIQMPTLDLDEFIAQRSQFTKEEWIDLLLRSVGFEPDQLSEKQKLHYLLRYVPMIQKNYNLVELGPRGTGKSHAYSEVSPYSILMSSGHTTVANLFYNVGRHSVGLVGHWDCVAFDEVGGMRRVGLDFVNMLKNFMANGTFARGTESISADASICFEGNTFKSVAEMLRTSTLFEPFPENFNMDSAFFDRIHAYLPGWETPQLKDKLFTSGYGLLTDCFSEFCHAMRKYDFTNDYAKYFTFNEDFNVRDKTAVTRTFSGLAKLIYPDEKMTKEEVKELLDYAIECRRRVKEQLKKMTPREFSKVDLGYIDCETNEETIVPVPEVKTDNLVSDLLEPAGFVYAVGRSYRGNLCIYHLENRKLSGGRGNFSSKNIEGLDFQGKPVRASLQAAFNFFKDHCAKVLQDEDYKDYDYTLYFNDLQNGGASDEVSLAELIGLFSAFTGMHVKNSMVICGRVTMSGTMENVTASLEDVIIACKNAGARCLMLSREEEGKWDFVDEDIKRDITPIFYSDPLDAVKKALGMM